jgi:glycosyltransferase involved in cell wall biosynthesis
MRVLLTDHSLLNGYTLGLAAGLRANGVQVWVGGPANSGEQRVTAIYPRSGIPGQRTRKAWEAGIGVASFPGLLAGARPDVFHIQWPTALNAAYALLAKRLYRIPLVYTVHNPTGRIKEPEPHQETQDRLIALADLILTHGPSMRQLVVDTHPRAAHKTHAVDIGNYENVIHRYPRAQARARLDLPVEVPLFVFVGQLRPRKGVDLLLEAFAEHRQHGGEGHLLIAGTATVPAYEARLREIADPCGSSVHWLVSTHPAPQSTLDLAISAATQVVLPFQDASHSASLVLAMTYGRCVVSTAVGEVSRTLDDRGILIGPGDRHELTQALALAERDTALCDELGERARNYALNELSWSNIGARTRELYSGIQGR